MTGTGKITVRFADGSVVQLETTAAEALAALRGRIVVGSGTTPIVTEDGLLGEAATTPAATGEEA